MIAKRSGGKQTPNEKIMPCGMLILLGNAAYFTMTIVVIANNPIIVNVDITKYWSGLVANNVTKIGSEIKNEKRSEVLIF